MTTTITLYRDNKLDQAVERDLDELAGEFWAHPIASIEWPIERRIWAWIGSREGLSSTIDPADFDRLADKILEVRR